MPNPKDQLLKLSRSGLTAIVQVAGLFVNLKYVNPFWANNLARKADDPRAWTNVNVPLEDILDIVDGKASETVAYRGTDTGELNPSKAAQSHVVQVIDGEMIWTPMYTDTTPEWDDVKSDWVPKAVRLPREQSTWRMPFDQFLMAAGIIEPMPIPPRPLSAKQARAKNAAEILAEQKAYAQRAAALQDRLDRIKGVKKPSAKTADKAAKQIAPETV